MKHERKYNPRECDNYLPSDSCSDDGGRATCLAHIAEGRAFDCLLERDGKARHCHFELKKKSAKDKE